MEAAQVGRWGEQVSEGVAEGQPHRLWRVPRSPKGQTLLLCFIGSKCYLLTDQPLTSDPFE